MTKEHAVALIHEIAEANIGVWHINIHGGEAILEPDIERKSNMLRNVEIDIIIDLSQILIIEL